MNDVRRRALKLGLVSLAALVGGALVLGGADYGYLALPDHAAPVFVALLTPFLLLLVRSIAEFRSGAPLPRGWPHQSEKPFGEP